MEKLDKLFVLLKRLIGREWFGKVELSIEKGVIANLKLTENIKL